MSGLRSDISLNSLNSPFSFQGLTLKNRIVMAPMCQYSVDTKDGMPNDWHFVHYISRAIGGTGLIIVEMSDVEPDGRITNYDLGLWSDEHIPAFKKLVDGVHKEGAKIGIQIAHAGRKAQDAIQPVSASDVPYLLHNDTEQYTQPRALSIEEIKKLVTKFKQAARRAIEAGFDTIELHGAHGYLLHQFMSPNSNIRSDEYGKDLAKFGVEVIEAVKSVMPYDMPLLMRLSAIEYIDGGYSIDHSLNMAKQFKDAGVDIFHISSGGEGQPGVLKPANYPGYQVPFAKQFKEELQVPVIAVGILEDPHIAQHVIQNEDIDLIAIGRGMLDNPYWAIHAIKEVTGEIKPPRQYERGMK